MPYNSYSSSPYSLSTSSSSSTLSGYSSGRSYNCGNSAFSSPLSGSSYTNSHCGGISSSQSNSSIRSRSSSDVPSFLSGNTSTLKKSFLLPSITETKSPTGNALKSRTRYNDGVSSSPSSTIMDLRSVRERLKATSAAADKKKNEKEVQELSKYSPYNYVPRYSNYTTAAASPTARYLHVISKGENRPKEINTKDINVNKKPPIKSTALQGDIKRDEDEGTISRNRQVVRLTIKRDEEEDPFSVKDKTLKTMAQRLMEKYVMNESTVDPLPHVQSTKTVEKGGPPGTVNAVSAFDVKTSDSPSAYPITPKAKTHLTFTPTSSSSSSSSCTSKASSPVADTEEPSEASVEFTAKGLSITKVAQKKELTTAEDVKEAIVAAVLHPDVDLESDEELKELVKSPSSSEDHPSKFPSVNEEEKEEEMTPKVALEIKVGRASEESDGEADDESEGTAIASKIKRFVKRVSTKVSSIKRSSTKGSNRTSKRGKTEKESKTGSDTEGNGEKKKQHPQRWTSKEKNDNNLDSKDSNNGDSPCELHLNTEFSFQNMDTLITPQSKRITQICEQAIIDYTAKAEECLRREGEVVKQTMEERGENNDAHESENDAQKSAQPTSKTTTLSSDSQLTKNSSTRNNKERIGKNNQTDEQKSTQPTIQTTSLPSDLQSTKKSSTKKKSKSSEKEDGKSEIKENILAKISPKPQRLDLKDYEAESATVRRKSKPPSETMANVQIGDAIKTQNSASVNIQGLESEVLSQAESGIKTGEEKILDNFEEKTESIPKNISNQDGEEKLANNRVEEKAEDKPLANIQPEIKENKKQEALKEGEQVEREKTDTKEVKLDNKGTGDNTKVQGAKVGAKEEKAITEGEKKALKRPRQVARAPPPQETKPIGPELLNARKVLKRPIKPKEEPKKTEEPKLELPKPKRLWKKPEETKPVEDIKLAVSALKKTSKTKETEIKPEEVKPKKVWKKPGTAKKEEEKKEEKEESLREKKVNISKGEGSQANSEVTSNGRKESKEKGDVTKSVKGEEGPSKEESVSKAEEEQEKKEVNQEESKDPSGSQREGKKCQSEDSGYGSSPGTPLPPGASAAPPTSTEEEICKMCNTNCHKKCEKLMPNLCGVNQKLLAEALSSVKKAGGTEKEVYRTLNVPPHPPSGGSSSETESTTETETEEETDSDVGPMEIRAPIQTRPKFKKYTLDDFTFIKVLGKGSFGKVMLAQQKDSENYFAVKCLKKDVVLEDNDVECTLIERKVLTLGTKHPYLCHLFCSFQTPSHLFFVMEYLTGGDLMFHIQHCGRFDEYRGAFYAAEIVSGLKFLHSKGIIYRDLKLDNILLDYEGHIRIADFGMCKLQIYLDRYADTFCGTPDYMAPEVIKGQHYNQCVDWWSFGVLLYEMLIGKSPFKGCDEDHLFWTICNEEPYYPKYLSREATNILKQTLDKDNSRRLGIQFSAYGEIKDHAFFKHIDWHKLERKEVETPYKPRLRSILDVKYFDSLFTKRNAALTPIDESILASMDQSAFVNFSYTNPNITD